MAGSGNTVPASVVILPTKTKCGWSISASANSSALFAENRFRSLKRGIVLTDALDKLKLQSVGNSEAHGILTKTCVICGKEFSTYKSRQKTCSTECSKIRSNKLSNVLAKKKRHEAGGRTREEIHEEAIKRKEAAEKKKAENIAYWLEFSERRVCECCGKEYIAHYPTSKYCSDKCSRHVSKEKRKYAGCLVDSDITLRRLAQRDDNICQICGLMVDWSDKMKAKGTVICGPMYPSIDHICPISKGGMHAWDNVQLVHRKCNSYKRDSIA